MTARIEVQRGNGATLLAIRNLERGGMRRVTNNAINFTLFDTRERVQKLMRRVFDQPTPFTVRGVRVQKSRVGGLQGRLFLRDEATKGTPPAKYLRHQVRGGDRVAKRTEVALRRADIILPDQFIAPGPDVRRNKFGNVSSGTYTRMLSALGASESGQNSSSGTKGWFLMRRRGKRIAIAQRLRTKTKIMFWILDDAPNYERRFRFKRFANQTARRLFSARFQRALSREVRRGLQRQAGQ